MRATIPLGVLLLLAGCAVTPEPQTAAYRQGYEQGCQSGRYASGLPVVFVQDAARMKIAGDDYALGWDRGYFRCGLDASQELQRERGRGFIGMAM